MTRLLRHADLWLALAGACLLAIAGVTIADVRREAADARRAQTAFYGLVNDSQHLTRLVLQATAAGHAGDETFRQVEATGRQIDARLRDAVVVDDDHPDTDRALDALTSFRAVAERMLSGLAHGNRQAGGAGDALGPAADQVASRMNQVERRRSSGARAAEDRAMALSIATVGGLFALLLVLVAIQQRGRRRAEVAAREAAAMAASEARFRGLVDDSSDLILLVGRAGEIRSASHAARDVLGFASEELEGLLLAEIAHPEDAGALAAATGERHRRLDLRLRHRNGYWLDVEAVANDMSAAADVGALVLTIRDVTERKAFEEQLRHRAFHDPLTQLANRALLLDRLRHALTREARYADQVALLFVDLDDFKVVNDTLGHASGDELLVQAASRLRSCLRSADTAARLGGDEFGVLLEDVADLDQAVAVARRIIEALGEPFSIGRHPVPLRASVGVALGSAQAISADELLRNADVAMYAAKRAGKSRHVVFRADRHAELARRFPGPNALDPDRVTWLERSEEQRNEVLRLLRAKDTVVPVFQPIVDLRTGAVAGYEALARFPHDPDSRPPNVWFAQAHRCGLGAQLEARATRAALDARAGAPGGYVSINITPAALRSDELLEELPLDLDDVLVEITEHELVADGERLHAMLDGLRARGARIAVDDAGAGYAGLRQLMLLRPDVIKLDRGLIEGVTGDEAKQALVECFVRFAERTSAEVCAEGIECLDDLLMLARLGVAYGQGYVIARPGRDWPVPSEEVCAALAPRPALR